jgi:polyisoprenoid-binding protein YceI
VETVFINDQRGPSDQRAAELSLPRRGVELDIAGDNFMLRGHFTDWESGLAFGPDLDRVNVRLAIDATSASAVDRDKRTLFGFASREVENEGRGTYQAHGTFTGPGGSAPTDMIIETPGGHTALIVVTFAAKKQDFGEGWHDLIANFVPFVRGENGAPARSAHAWLTAPVLAAA